MKKVNLNLYESFYPPTNTNVLWVDKNSNGEIKAIHKYSQSKGKWIPYLVSVDYMNPDNNL